MAERTNKDSGRKKPARTNSGVRARFAGTLSISPFSAAELNHRFHVMRLRKHVEPAIIESNE